MKKWLIEQLIGLMLVVGFFSWLFSIMSMVELMSVELWQGIWFLISIIVMVVAGYLYKKWDDKSNRDWKKSNPGILVMDEIHEHPSDIDFEQFQHKAKPAVKFYHSESWAQHKRKYEKPHIGIIPRWLHREHSICDLKDAVNRYIEADRYEECVINWIIEIRELESEQLNDSRHGLHTIIRHTGPESGSQKPDK